MLKAILIAVVGLYACAVAIMYTAQRHFMYFPSPARTLPAAVGLSDVLERVIATPDGEKVLAWYGKAKPGQPTLLYFHGNGGDLANRADRIRAFLDRGRGIFMMSYRGYSGSTGSPTEAANVADAKLAYDALLREGVLPADIIIYGESLGTSVGIQVARDKPVAGLILDSPFTSIGERAAQLYPWLPIATLLKDRYDSLAVIGEVRVPLLIVHGSDDHIVPLDMGRRVFDKANAPKEMKVISGAGHSDHYAFGSFELINNWIDRLRAGSRTYKSP